MADVLPLHAEPMLIVLWGHPIPSCYNVAVGTSPKTLSGRLTTASADEALRYAEQLRARFGWKLDKSGFFHPTDRPTPVDEDLWPDTKDDGGDAAA